MKTKLFQRETLDGIKALYRIVAGKNDIIEQQKELIKDLREEKKDLLNRLMAVDYTKLQMYQDVPFSPISVPEVTIPEEMAGEIVEEE